MVGFDPNTVVFEMHRLPVGDQRRRVFLSRRPLPLSALLNKFWTNLDDSGSVMEKFWWTTGPLSLEQGTSKWGVLARKPQILPIGPNCGEGTEGCLSGCAAVRKNQEPPLAT